jgi:hypothetical protein
MRENRPEVEDWKSLQEKADIFFSKFDGLVLENDEGKKITFRVKNFLVSNNSPIWDVELEGYPGAGMTFLLDYKNKRLTIENFVKFEHPDLKSKGVFSQIRRFVGKNFPEGLEYCINVWNERTKKQLLEVRKKYKRKLLGLSLAQAHNQILQNYWVQEEIAAGFNNIKVVYDSDSQVRILESKVTLPGLQFTVDFN